MGSPIFPLILVTGVNEIEVEIVGELLNKTLFPESLDVEIEVGGSLLLGLYIIADPIEIVISIEATYTVVDANRGNWVKWSDVGSLKFVINERNVAGERPLDWSGQVYELIKLDKFVVAYGSNGITIMNPVENKWGIKTIHRLGIKGKGAVVGNEDEHYCIDVESKLYKVSSQGFELLDYSEYLSLLTSPRMSLDIATGIIYICDGTYGFVYSIKSKSFGTGPVNVTGIGNKNSVLYVVGDGEIDVPKLHICTDIYDFGNRQPKTIEYVEVGTDLTSLLSAMIEARNSNKENFRSSSWILVNPSGIAFIPCFGVEFKVHLKSLIYEYLEIDYIKIGGMIHGFNYLNQVQ